jgi:hypothetical protein
MTIRDLVAARGITEVLHFTTNRGLLGIAAKQAVLSRDLLDSDDYLEHIGDPVWTSRWKDADWTGYVNMSISHVSYRMFAVSRRNKSGQKDAWWPVLSFDPEIMSHEGVVFATTNNSYEDTVRRGVGVEGLEALFGPAIPWGYHGTVSHRRNGSPDSWTTNDQAEVLYPGQLGLDHLQAVYVESDDLIDDASTILGMWEGTSRVPVSCKPEVYK